VQLAEAQVCDKQDHHQHWLVAQVVQDQLQDCVRQLLNLVDEAGIKAQRIQDQLIILEAALVEPF
jgi:hypothetical protein